MDKLIPITGAVQHYNWGGHSLIPDLLGMPNPKQKPFAEVWLGSHPAAPATTTIGNEPVKLDALFAEHGAELGNTGGLPYLFKVLDARQMLSIQAHPTKAQAEAGYNRENAAGVALTAPNRNYKDRNHKPEVHVALTEFYLLHGFRTLESLAEELARTPELSALCPDYAERLADAGADAGKRESLLRAVYERAMTLPQSDVDTVLNALLSRLGGTNPPKDSPDFWAIRAASEFPLPDGHRDRGIFSVYLLNLVRLAPGQGTYQPAGVLHAYLKGANMELMAASDNVLRGGLTPKHVDVPELLSVVDFAQSGMPEILEGDGLSSYETCFPTPATEFRLSVLAFPVPGAETLRAENGADTLFVYKGAVTVTAGNETQTIERGYALLIASGADYTVTANEAAEVYRAVVPTGA